MAMLAAFFCALNLGLACLLIAAEKADDNLRRIEHGEWDESGGLGED